MWYCKFNWVIHNHVEHTQNGIICHLPATVLVEHQHTVHTSKYTYQTATASWLLSISLPETSAEEILGCQTMHYPCLLKPQPHLPVQDGQWQPEQHEPTENVSETPYSTMLWNLWLYLQVMWQVQHWADYLLAVGTAVRKQAGKSESTVHAVPMLLSVLRYNTALSSPGEPSIDRNILIAVMCSIRALC
jgi:hypothetical protein